MKFSDFILKNSIITGLKATTKDGVIKEMVGSLSEAGGISEGEVDSIVTAIMRREELGTTGIGRGVAVPHTKHISVERLVGVVAITGEDGVDFSSMDCDPVRLFFLLVSPPDRPGEHLRALEHITRQLKNDAFCRDLKQATSVDEVWSCLEKADDNGYAV